MAWTKRDQVEGRGEKRPPESPRDRQRQRERSWAEEKAEYLVENPECEFFAYVDAVESLHDLLIPQYHAGPLDVHHVQPRGMGGSKAKLKKATLCRRHHDWAETYRRRAREAGLLIRRTPEVSR